jgi:hypothetical protein
MVNNAPRIAVASCIHHKPWLIQSTLISLFAQQEQDYDIFFLLNEGDGEISDTVRAILDANDIRETDYRNPQLDPFDESVLDYCPLHLKNVELIRYKNDDALDSGAWYKFVLSKRWEPYDFVLFLGEGGLLTHRFALRDFASFCQQHGEHFVSSGHEKRRIPKKQIFSGFIKKSDRLSRLHNQMITRVYDIFCRDPNFDVCIKSMGDLEKTQQQNHVPNIWGPSNAFLHLDALFFRREEKKNRFRSLVRRVYEKIEYFQKKFGFFSCSQTARRSLSKLVITDAKINKRETQLDQKNTGFTLFHQETDPSWFGATCNHFASTQLLRKFRETIEEHKLAECLGLPYSATALEFMWGIVPLALGYRKWFCNGIHRVRKQFISYGREDSPEGMVRYLNRYFQGQILCRTEGDRIAIVRSRRVPRLNELKGFWK